MDRQDFHALMLSFLREANPEIAIDRVRDDEDLVALGYIDSLRIMELIATIEQQAGIDILLDAIDARDFRTAGGIYGVVLAHGAA